LSRFWCWIRGHHWSVYGVRPSVEMNAMGMSEYVYGAVTSWKCKRCGTLREALNMRGRQ
jgi:hypothetical protein